MLQRLITYPKHSRTELPSASLPCISVTASCFVHAFCLGIGLAPSIPEDLWHLVKKAVAVRKHLEVNRKDKDSKFRLILIESRIHRLARYYKTKQQIPPTFKYDSATASTLIA